MERDPRPMDNEDDPMPAPGADVYDQPTGAPHHLSFPLYNITAGR